MFSVIILIGMFEMSWYAPHPSSRVLFSLIFDCKSLIIRHKYESLIDASISQFKTTLQ